MNLEYLNKEGIVTYGDLIIKEGNILGNDFSYNINNSQASLWIINNASKVKSTLSWHMKKTKVVGGDVEDCYNFAIYYFLDNREREVVLNFFGDDSNYDVEKYCMSNLKFVVFNYKNSLQKVRGANVANLIDTEEMEKYTVFGSNTNQLTYDNSLTKSGDYEDPSTHKDYVELKEGLKRELLMYDTYFKDKGYIIFDVLNYFAYLFFNAEMLEVIEEESGDKESFREGITVSVANRLGMSKDLSRIVYDELTKGVKKGEEDESDILKIVSYYIGEGLRNITYDTNGVEVKDWEDIHLMYI